MLNVLLSLEVRLKFACSRPSSASFFLTETETAAAEHPRQNATERRECDAPAVVVTLACCSAVEEFGEVLNTKRKTKRGDFTLLLLPSRVI